MSYIVPVHRPSGARLAHKCHFLDPQTETVVVAKANRLEFYNYTPDGGLTLVHARAIYGYVIMLESIRPSSSSTDHLFVGTDRYQYFTCSWDAETKQIKTEQSYVDQGDKTLKDTRENDRVNIDPSGRYMTLELFDGIVTVIPFVQSSTKKLRRDSSALVSNVPGTLGEPIQVRTEEMDTRASAYQVQDEDSGANPRLAILWEDNQRKPQLKIRELKYTATGEQPSAELPTVAELHAELDEGVSHLIPVPLPYSGFLVLGERSIFYVDPELKQLHQQSLDDQATIWACWTKVDESRWLLADEYASLYFLMLVVQDQTVKGWRLDPLGRAAKASQLVYLDEGLVFIASHSGDSQVVQIQEQGVQTVQTFSNIAPILDVQLMDLGRATESSAQPGEFSSGQARLVTASGAWQDGSIRTVRSGVGMEELGDIGEIPLIVDMWGLSTHGKNARHDVLLLSFATETRVFKFDADAGVEEVDTFYNIELGEPTLLAVNLPDQRLLQVHDTGIRISDLDSTMSILQWKPSDQVAQLTGAAANDVYILVIEGGHTVHVFRTSTQDSHPNVSQTFEANSQISSVTIPQTQSDICVVSFSQAASVAILDVRSLQTLSTHSLGTPSIDVPRTVLLADVHEEGPPMLLVSMADGTVVTFNLDVANSSLTGMNKILLGSEPVFLKALPLTSQHGHGLVNVFASCEQPSLIYATEGRIIYSAINSDEAARVCSFDCESYPDAIAVASPTDLKLAMIDKKRTTQIQTLPVGQTVRCLTYQPRLKVFGLGCVNRTMDVDADEGPREALHSYVSLVDEVKFQEIDRHALEDDELVECITTFDSPVVADNDEEEEDDETSVLLVGTSIDSGTNGVTKDDRGRLLVFSVNSKRQKLNLLTQLTFRGAVRSLAIADGMVVVGLIKVVKLYSLQRSRKSGSKYSHKLTARATYRTSTDPLTLAVQPATASTPVTIAVGDLMKSVSILSIIPPSSSNDEEYELAEMARHYATLWTSAVAAVGEREWVAADMEGNLAMLRHNSDAYGDEAHRLEVSGEMRLGEVVNKIVPIPQTTITTSQNSINVATAAAADKGKARTGSTTSRPPQPTTTVDLTQDLGPLVRPQAFLATVEGSIYLLGAINTAYTDALLRLQAALASRVLAPGYMPWSKYRAWKTEVREADEPFRFIDGEMVESGLLNLPDAALLEVLREAGLDGSANVSADKPVSGLTVERVRAWGEELRRLY